MYIVEWTDFEGILNWQTFVGLEDANLEAASLKERSDYVKILPVEW